MLTHQWIIDPSTLNFWSFQFSILLVPRTIVPIVLCYFSYIFLYSVYIFNKPRGLSRLIRAQMFVKVSNRRLINGVIAGSSLCCLYCTQSTSQMPGTCSSLLGQTPVSRPPQFEADQMWSWWPRLQSKGDHHNSQNKKKSNSY